MIARLNFLIACSASVVIAFFIVGRYVLLEALLRIAPVVVPYFSAAFTLIALMLTVLALAKTVIRLESTSVAARVRPAGVKTLAAQTVICLGHAVVFYGTYTFFVSDSLTMDERPGSFLPLLLALVLYVSGVAIAIADWRERAMSASD